MILTPQETLIMKGVPHDEIIKGLVHGLSINILKPLSNSNGIIKAVTENDDLIPAFNIPVIVTDTLGRDCICIDLRKSNREYKLDGMGNSYEPLMLTEANFLTNTGLLQYIWKESKGDFNPIYMDCAKVYGLWISAKIAKRLVLNPIDQNKLNILFVYYFLTRTFNPIKEMDEREKELVINRIANNLGFNASEVSATIKSLPKDLYLNIEDFCKDINKVLDNPKLNNFNRILLQTILLGSYLGGSNSREITSIAVEYPPMFISILYRSLNERNFSKNDISLVASKIMNKLKINSFNMTVASILKTVAGR